MKPPAPVRAVSRVTSRLAQRVGQRLGQRFDRGATAAPTGADIIRIDRSVVSVSYDPHPDGKPDPGEVVWLWIPYQEDSTIGKDRPAVVIGWDDRQHLAVVPLTSKFHSGEVSVGIGSWDGSRRRSYAKVDQIYAASRSFVRREGASLPKPAFDQVIAALN
jgi:mRNA-degrading endonuclease toxin of MazEF toxin-antitoxin module